MTKPKKPSTIKSSTPKSATFPRLLDYGSGVVREDQLLSVTPLSGPTAKGFEFVVQLVDGRQLWLRCADAEVLYTAITGKPYRAELGEVGDETEA